MDNDAPPLTPVVEGLRLLERSGEAGPGEVWLARITGGLAGAGHARLPGDLHGVGECFVRLIRLPVDEPIRARARMLGTQLAALDDPGLVGVREMRDAYDGLALLLAPLPAPLTGLHLLVRRRLLAAGEVVTLGVALCWALAAAHRVGITHGRLRDSDVLLDPAGRPLLAGAGVMGLLGDAGEPAEDVRALTRLLGSVLEVESASAGRLLAVLRAPHDDAARLAAELAACAPAAPIHLSDEAASDARLDEPEPSRKRRPIRRRRPRAGTVDWRRALRIGAAGAAILVLAGVVGWVTAPAPRAGRQPSTSLPPPSRGLTSASPAVVPTAPPARSWAGVLAGLDAAREAAFRDPHTAEVAAFDVAGSPAARYDQSAVEALRQAGAHAVGLRLVTDRVVLLARAGRDVTLDVTDRRPAYTVTDGRSVLSRVTARSAQRHHIVLRDVGPGGASPQWRFAEDPRAVMSAAGSPERRPERGRGR